MIRASQADTVANLEALRPTLAQLTKAGDDLPASLRLLLSFPFPDNAASGAIKGDYANLHATLDVNLAELLKQNAAALGSGGRSGLPSLPGLSGLPPVPSQPALPHAARPVHPARPVRCDARAGSAGGGRPRGSRRRGAGQAARRPARVRRVSTTTRYTRLWC